MKSLAPQSTKSVDTAECLLQEPHWLLSYAFNVLALPFSPPHSIVSAVANSLFSASTATSFRLVHSVTKFGSYVSSLMGPRSITQAQSPTSTFEAEDQIVCHYLADCSA